MKLDTKQDFQQWMYEVLNPLKPLYSEGCARLHLGDSGVTYPQVSIEMEAFSRPLWALVPLWLGGGKGFEDIYQKGLANGTNPSHPEYWGGFNDYDQRFVEMAAIASGLIFTPEKIWEPLSEEEKSGLAKWLYGINEHAIPDCNWQFFMILVNIALQKLGRPYSKERLSSGLAGIKTATPARKTTTFPSPFITTDSFIRPPWKTRIGNGAGGLRRGRRFLPEISFTGLMKTALPFLMAEAYPTASGRRPSGRLMYL